MPEAGGGGDAATDPPKRIRRLRSFTYVPPHVESAAPARPAHVRFADEIASPATAGGSGNTASNTPVSSGGSSGGTAVNTSVGQGSNNTSTSTNQAKSEPPKDCQPTSFPAVGSPPGSAAFPGAPGTGLSQQWYTSADPTRSVSGPAPYAHHHRHLYQQPHQLAPAGGVFATGAPYPVGQPFQVPQHQQPGNMSIPYVTAVGPQPPTEGLNFQPPVPDNSNGPMQHVYVPRFDAAAPGGPAVAVHVQPGVHVGHHHVPSVSIVYHAQPAAPPAVPVAAVAAAPVPAAYPHATVLVNGVPYHASASARLLPPARHSWPHVRHALRLLGPSGRLRKTSFPPYHVTARVHAHIGFRRVKRMHANTVLQPQSVPGTVPVGQPGYVVYQGMPQQLLAPGQMGQPQMPGQTVMLNGQAYYPIAAPPTAVPGQPMPTLIHAGAGVPAVAPAFLAGTAPAPVPHEVPGLGRTPQEEVLHQVQFAYNNKLFEPQDIKPGDDDPSRFYYVREVDGNWTQRSRYSIDQIPCRWYVTDEGWFYAVRLPD
ncbi:pre-mRNA splicing factor CWC21 [Purpureocillium lavendulum]|uniref:Pre-mRNA splicing factor CWC21 n=1 Tax=Purpureocillium lavendulum TaxID=1247861 RepID=A0AB34G081_9HYPO|nr:pre-mRNA splicing factor CWC21 [Purpureocillium lavendulum]